MVLSTAPDGPVELDGARAFQVEVNGRRFQVRVAEANGSGRDRGTAPPTMSRGQARKQTKHNDAAGVSLDVVKSPMGGTVMAVKVGSGDEVNAGQVLAVVEAMKMENEIVAPRAGIIQDVSVSPGAAIQAGDIVVSFAR
jgi:acetyl-CoA/propionyl-CoA carboxylase biotin carboxyl carrier protein